MGDDRGGEATGEREAVSALAAIADLTGCGGALDGVGRGGPAPGLAGVDGVRAVGDLPKKPKSDCCCDDLGAMADGGAEPKGYACAALCRRVR